MLIILAGTSSSGKSTLSNESHKRGFDQLSIDDIPLEDEHGKPYYSGFRNDYLVQKLADEIGTKDNLVVDTLADPDLGPSAILNLVKRPALKVLVYASPLELEKRVDQRGDRRISNVLNHLTAFQAVKPEQALDRIDFVQLYEILERHQQEFANQADLIGLIAKIATDLGSEWIGPSEEYDLILKNLSIQQAVDQLNL